MPIDRLCLCTPGASVRSPVLRLRVLVLTACGAETAAPPTAPPARARVSPWAHRARGRSPTMVAYGLWCTVRRCSSATRLCGASGTG
eukprot:6458241-Prymnesium_polylepis.1